MPRYVLYDRDTGVIEAQGSAPRNFIQLQSRDNLLALEVSDIINERTHYVKHSAVVRRPSAEE